MKLNSLASFAVMAGLSVSLTSALARQADAHDGKSAASSKPASSAGTVAKVPVLNQMQLKPAGAVDRQEKAAATASKMQKKTGDTSKSVVDNTK